MGEESTLHYSHSSKGRKGRVCVAQGYKGDAIPACQGHGGKGFRRLVGMVEHGSTVLYCG